MVNELSYIIGLIALWLYLYDDTCILYGIRFRNLCFTLALSVNNLFEERRKTNAEFIFLLFPHKVT
jgi:hypothetical protein